MQKITIDGLEDMEFTVLDNPKYTTKVQLLYLYWTFHPRFRFFKTLPLNSRLLDIGAASGGLSFWKEWELPKRDDIEMYGLDLSRGEFFDQYKDFQILDLDDGHIKYEDDFFDAILMSHVLEHIKDENKIVKEIKRLLKTGGIAYIEMPTLQTLTCPSKHLFLDKGINVTTMNFFDDHTHLRTFDKDGMEDLFTSHKFNTLSYGVIQNKYLEDELFTYGMNNNDQETTQYSVWSKLKWAQYLVVQKM